MEKHFTNREDKRQFTVLGFNLQPVRIVLANSGQRQDSTLKLAYFGSRTGHSQGMDELWTSAERDSTRTTARDPRDSLSEKG